MIIYSCWWKHWLLSDQSDQIAETFVQSRTIKKTKASLYSNECQMFQQNGSFSGIDICDHISFGYFEKPSILIF